MHGLSDLAPFESPPIFLKKALRKCGYRPQSILYSGKMLFTSTQSERVWQMAFATFACVAEDVEDVGLYHRIGC